MLVALTCVYMAFVYAVFYMLLVIFPDIFEGIYGFSAGESGLAFIMMFTGSIITVVAQNIYDRYSPALVRRHPTKQAEYLRLPPACVGGPLFVVSLFWLGWTAKISVPWIVPLLSMIPYGVAYQMIFMSMINCKFQQANPPRRKTKAQMKCGEHTMLTFGFFCRRLDVADAYGIYASSALAACAAARSVAGAVIPLAVASMVETLGIAWSCSLLAFISLGLSFVPLGFIIWGEKIRAGSKFSSRLQTEPHPELELTRSLSMA